MATERSTLVMENVIKPLLEQPASGEFLSIVQEASRALQLAQLGSIRDVEVMLIANCHVSFLQLPFYYFGTDDLKRLHAPGANYEAYRDAATTLCNQYMSLCSKFSQSPNPAWRNAYYARHVDHIEAVSARLTREQNPSQDCLLPARSLSDASSHTSSNICTTPSLAMARDSLAGRKLPPLSVNVSSSAYTSSASRGTPSTMLSRDSLSTMNTSPSSTTSFALSSPTTLKGQYCSESVTTTWTDKTAPAPSIQSASLMRTPSSTHLSSTDDVSYCEYCGVSFHGKYANRTSNLRRHQKTAHQKGNLLPCSEPDCDRNYGRADHLRIHQRNAHGHEVPLARPQKTRSTASRNDNVLK